ncbi:hypothetical protein N7E81_14525 [Reichenbachiella carrageenanivorans]|uniref:Uncharacterized protein n=1 Tax=Reichenbachiella carrageenanivorans TaxID=2979869 RepID=A0ABY6D0H9_9BACT|nr:hypothetical protein [Reichenbachiella carrageenanivorans]UXX78573.1 hypothetical protein N7E81_14525 [Reichenbachiella carrageenanivorans]
MSLEQLINERNEAILKVDEYGLLCMTTPYMPPEVKHDPSKQLLYTSKQAYMWVPILAYIVENVDISEEDMKIFLEMSLDSLTTHHRTRWSNRAEALEGMLEMLNSMLFYTTRKKLEDPIFEYASLFGGSIEDILDRLEGLSLVEEHYIEPIGNQQVAMMGFVPFGFTKRTRLGEELFAKLNSLMLFYAQKNLVEESDFKIHYKFFRAWEIFKEIVMKMDKPLDKK